MAKLILNEDLGFEDYVDAGVSNIIIDVMNAKWDLIRNINSLITTISEYDDYDVLINSLNDMIEDESRHIGNLESYLGAVADFAEPLVDGQDEMQEIIDGPLDEGLVKPRRNKEIREDAEDLDEIEIEEEPIEPEFPFYVSYYVEDTDGTDEYTITAILKNYKGFDSEEEALEYLQSLGLEERGFIAEAPEYYVKRNPNGPEKFYIIETELGEQTSTDDIAEPIDDIEDDIEDEME